eukprot:CAMPEP_0119320526 /NCGR_PEP_ID=MMETSP1333-20130426/52716_1 /TAXON_ID=418940 /ORGANISM="Scyphosphaera apsteinii, Strain RCC1455" /LENGTH=72 /DNA_ID=CAMNT_0007327267 /DNA_START=113 /DNA_END=331 /DNA_ORIENTATION=-
MLSLTRKMERLGNCPACEVARPRYWAWLISQGRAATTGRCVSRRRVCFSTKPWRKLLSRLTAIWSNMLRPYS